MTSDTALIRPFVEAFGEVLSTMAMMECTTGSPTVKESHQAQGDVTGIIGLTGNRLKASLAISFPRAVLVDIMTRLFGESPEEMDEQVSDLVGELTNMTTGGAKRLLAEAGYDFDMAVPAVISGEKHLIDHKASGTTLVTPVHTESGDIFLELCFEHKA